MDIHVIDYELATAAGANIEQLRKALVEQRSGLRVNDIGDDPLDTWVGRVADVEQYDDLGPWQSRNNALAALGLHQGTLLETLGGLKKRFSSHRVGVVMGSSTSSIDRTETAYHFLEQGRLTDPFKQPQVHNPHGPALFAAYMTGISGPALTINTACSSSAKVFATGARWLQCGLVDAVLVGGVDSLCLSVLHGFDSLQLVSKHPCRPFDRDRDGINLGEAAGFAVLMRSTDLDDATREGIVLRGVGESSDAYHMSHPHPEGLGARLAIEQALAMAQLSPQSIDYINLHGTASRANDDIEGRLISELFPKTTWCSSTKGWTGHTLGAAGITEGLIAADTLITGVLPGTLNLSSLGEGFDFSIEPSNRQQTVRTVMSNSFGFGGNNCSLIFGLAGERV